MGGRQLVQGQQQAMRAMGSGSEAAWTALKGFGAGKGAAVRGWHEHALRLSQACLHYGAWWLGSVSVGICGTCWYGGGSSDIQ